MPSYERCYAARKVFRERRGQEVRRELRAHRASHAIAKFLVRSDLMKLIGSN